MSGLPPHGQQMSVALADLLRDKEVDEHACLRANFDNYCGLSPSHPANSGQFMYNFSDPDLNLQGHSVQTLIGGVCLDDSCQTITPVALHADSCTYTVDLDADDDTTLAELSSLVTALITVEKVTVDSMKRAGTVSHYGVVHRNDKREWTAVGYRQVRVDKGYLGLFLSYSLFVLPVFAVLRRRKV